jgi:hypothetical protein
MPQCAALSLPGYINTGGVEPPQGGFAVGGGNTGECFFDSHDFLLIRASALVDDDSIISYGYRLSSGECKYFEG